MNLKNDKNIAYFSMEIGISAEISTYSGGLGILAGDTLKACADLKVPIVGVSLLYRCGALCQSIDSDGIQHDYCGQWNPNDYLIPMEEKVSLYIENREIILTSWLYKIIGSSGYEVPIIFITTDNEFNNGIDRELCSTLYGGDQKYRLAQEFILGVGGVKMIRKLGFYQIKRFHMNEGHSSLLTLELIKERNQNNDLSKSIDRVRRMCVFTTHTPVPAGFDKFPYDLVEQVLGNYAEIEFIKNFGGDDILNMTLLALNLSHYINGVAKEHKRVSQNMFPSYQIDAITNGIHSATWICDSFKKLFDKYISGWINDSYNLRYALSIPGEEIWDAHKQAKIALLDYINNKNNIDFSYDVLTIGFARRATAYKRADLIFYDIERLASICEKTSKIQLIFAGKAHPADWQGKEIIKKIVKLSGELRDRIKIVYLENYNMELAKKLVAGVDLWLNTPRKPQEASGTSGMKAAHNGVPSFSILDGWWIEGYIKNITGWTIGSMDEMDSNDKENANSLYDNLENIIHVFYNQQNVWIDIMRNSIAINASFFNTHRMVQQYVLNAYLY